VFAKRRVLFSTETTIDLILHGFHTIRKNLGNVIKLALANLAVMGCMGILLLMLLGSIGGGAFFFFFSTLTEPSIPAIILVSALSGPLVVSFIILMQIFKGFLQTYYNFTWSNLYAHIENLDDNTVSNLQGEQA
jgi:hypothetical protein